MNMDTLKKKKKTVGITSDIYEIIKNYCNKEGYIIQNFIEKTLLEKIKNKQNG